jgi:type II secretory pathway pseudopilin PulG
MVATMVFSIILVIALTGIVQVSRAYYKGVTRSRTQDTARNLMNEISQSIQLSGSDISISNPLSAGPNIPVNNRSNGIGIFCAGNKQYTYALDRKVASTTNEAEKNINNAVVSEDIPCVSSLTPFNLDNATTGTQKAVLGENMRLTKFNVSRVNPATLSAVVGTAELWRVEISLAYGDQDLLEYTDDSGASRVVCKAQVGAEFCSIVELSTIVSRRIGN